MGEENIWRRKTFGGEKHLGMKDLIEGKHLWKGKYGRGKRRETFGGLQGRRETFGRGKHLGRERFN